MCWEHGRRVFKLFPTLLNPLVPAAFHSIEYIFIRCVYIYPSIYVSIYLLILIDMCVICIDTKCMQLQKCGHIVSFHASWPGDAVMMASRTSWCAWEGICVSSVIVIGSLIQQMRMAWIWPLPIFSRRDLFRGFFICTKMFLDFTPLAWLSSSYNMRYHISYGCQSMSWITCISPAAGSVIMDKLEVYCATENIT